jgi:plasmid replication initiation protein
MSKKALKERPFIRDMVITSSSWGEIRYTGPKLSTYDEDVLMAVLALLDQIRHRETTDVEGKTTYTYRGPVLPFLKLMGLSRGAANYQRLLESLELLHSAVVKLFVYKRDSSGKRKIARWNMSNILIMSQGSDEAQELAVTVNPYFYEIYNQGLITLLDVIKRNRLKSPIAKSLYRFIKSHRDGQWSGHFLTLATALNLEETLPPKKKKERIKLAIRTLVQEGILEKGSGFLKNNPDVVNLVCTSGTTKKSISKSP